MPIFGEIYTEKKIANNHLAKKYCDSLEKNLFKGLDKESTLKSVSYTHLRAHETQ